MLLDEYDEDGLLIEAEGFDYPRLSMFVPDAKSIYERYQTSEPELKLHDMIKDTVEKIAELAHTDKTDFTSADIINMDEVESLIKNAIVQQLAQRDDIKMAENTDIGVDFQPDIHVEAEKLAELKFYCPLKVQREIRPSFDEDEDEFLEDTEELSDFEVLEYESEISDAIEAYQSDEEENRGIMAYLGDRKLSQIRSTPYSLPLRRSATGSWEYLPVRYAENLIATSMTNCFRSYAVKQVMGGASLLSSMRFTLLREISTSASMTPAVHGTL